ncbi:MAG: cobalamin-dependent protein [Chloroflexota bacterium]
MNSLREQADVLAEAIVERIYESQPQVWKPYGSVGRQKSVRDTHYHLEYLAEALEADAPELFTSYLAWVKALFVGLGFSDAVLPNTLKYTRLVLGERLPEEQRAPALQMIDEGLRSLQDHSDALTSYISGNNPSDQLARRYLEALLIGDRQSASQLILQAVGTGMPVKEVYLQIFQRTQHEIGRLWQVNQISVAQEHYCTAATQMIMSQLYPQIFAGAKNGHTLVATCVDGELHEIGARMVADLLELDGWDTHFLGANTPTQSVLQMLAQRQAAILAISATMTFHLDKVRELIVETRQSGLKVHILVGGQPFNQVANLWQQVGADGYAADAEQAVATADRLIT